jgi:predicted DNA-binding transcriptional regulator YafY
MNRTDRLVAMVMYLQGRRLARAEDMSAHFEVSVRTIYRDIAALSESGVPIVGEAGVGYSLLKSYSLPPVMLTAEEASSLFMGAELAKQLTDGSLKSPLEAALLKLRAVLPRDRQDHIDQLTKRTVIFGPGMRGGNKRDEREWLLPLQEAAVRCNVVRMVYRSRDRDETTREVEPLGASFYGGIWYLIAWCRLRGEMRHFRFDRIESATVCPEKFQPRHGFSLREHLAACKSQSDLILVRLRLRCRVIERLRRESILPLHEVKRDAEWMEVSMSTHSLDWLGQWLLAFGPEVEALDPPELRVRIREQAEHIAGIYSEQSEPVAQLV